MRHMDPVCFAQTHHTTAPHHCCHLWPPLLPGPREAEECRSVRRTLRHSYDGTRQEGGEGHGVGRVHECDERPKDFDQDRQVRGQPNGLAQVWRVNGIGFEPVEGPLPYTYTVVVIWVG